MSPAKLDRLERVTDLVLVLLDAPQPLTLEAIATQVPGYPAEHAARRQAFERDKRLLREEGIPVATVPLPGHEQFGYQIDREDFYLPDLGLEPDEQAALHLAVAGVHLGDPSGRDALLKLGAAGLGDVRPVAALAPSPALGELFEAVRTGVVAAFSYRGEARQVAPFGLRFRFGHWYLVAWDLERSAVRTFRVDRIDGGVERGVRRGDEIPGDVDVDAALPQEPWDVEGSERIEMQVRIDALEARRVVDEVGPDKVLHWNPDGSVDLSLGVAGFASIRSWVLGFLDHATVVAPPEFRRELVEWLGALVTRSGGTAGREPPCVSEEDVAVTGQTSGNRSAPGVETSRRLRRLLALVGWLAQVGEAPLSEAARRFGMDEHELVAELELAACCGTPPYTPDTLMEIEVSEHTVRAFLPPQFARPRRLTPAEGFAVAASARVLLAVPGSDDDALRRALAKLEAALGAREAVAFDVDAPAHLAPVRRAVDQHRGLQLDYLSGSRDELTTRRVDPAQVVTIDGHWYLDAYCYRAKDVRRFRVDRIVGLRELDEPGDGPVPMVRPLEEMFVPGPGAVEVELELGPAAQWVPESVPVRRIRRSADGGVSGVVLDVSGLAWFERLLLQLGPDARVVRPPELTTLASEAAQRVLVRYAQTDDGA
jgi:predicted DNA-binding transcriptional regulator YafY